MTSIQQSFFDYEFQIKIKEKPYQNGLGEPLPWEVIEKDSISEQSEILFTETASIGEL